MISCLLCDLRQQNYNLSDDDLDNPYRSDRWTVQQQIGVSIHDGGCVGVFANLVLIIDVNETAEPFLKWDSCNKRNNGL